MEFKNKLFFELKPQEFNELKYILNEKVDFFAKELNKLDNSYEFDFNEFHNKDYFHDNNFSVYYLNYSLINHYNSFRLLLSSMEYDEEKDTYVYIGEDIIGMRYFIEVENKSSFETLKYLLNGNTIKVHEFFDKIIKP